MKNKYCKAMGIMLAGALVVSGFSPALASAAGDQITAEEPAVEEAAPEVLAVFVDIEEGDDTADGSSAGQAVKTVEQAAALLQTGAGSTAQKYIVFVGLLKGEISGLMKHAPAGILGVTEAAYEAVVSVKTEEETPEPVETPKADEPEAPTEEVTEGEAEAPTEEASEEEAEAPTEEAAEGEAEAPTEEASEGEAETPAEEATEGEAEAPTEEASEGEAEAPTEEETEGEAEAPTEEVTEGEAETPTEEVTEGEAEAPTEEAADDEAETVQESLIVENAAPVFLVETFSSPSYLSSASAETKTPVFLAPQVEETTQTTATADTMLASAEQGLSIQSDDTMTADAGTQTADLGVSLFSIGGITIVGKDNYTKGDNTATAGGNTSGGTSSNTSSNQGNKNQSSGSSTSGTTGNKGTSTASNTGNRTNTTKTESTVRVESVNTGDTAMVLPLAISSVLSAAVLVFLAYLQTVTKRAEAALAWRKFREEHPILEDFEEE